MVPCQFINLSSELTVGEELSYSFQSQPNTHLPIGLFVSLAAQFLKCKHFLQLSFKMIFDWGDHV